MKGAKMNRKQFFTVAMLAGAGLAADVVPVGAGGKPRPDGCAEWDAFAGDLAYCQGNEWPVLICTANPEPSSWTPMHVIVVTLPAIPGCREITLGSKRMGDLPALLAQAIAARKGG